MIQFSYCLLLLRPICLSIGAVTQEPGAFSLPITKEQQRDRDEAARLAQNEQDLWMLVGLMRKARDNDVDSPIAWALLHLLKGTTPECMEVLDN